MLISSKRMAVSDLSLSWLIQKILITASMNGDWSGTGHQVPFLLTLLFCVIIIEILTVVFLQQQQLVQSRVWRFKGGDQI
jgi:hypothetical protein